MTTDELRARLATAPGIERHPAISASVHVDETVWEHDLPVTCVGGFLLDEALRFPVGKWPKSGWSLPSGEHQNGMSLHEQLAMLGLDETHALFDSTIRHRYLGAVENIFPSLHCVVNMLALFPLDLRYIVSKKPELKLALAKFKHERNKTSVVFCDTEQPITDWAPGLGEWIEANARHLRKVIAELARPSSA